MKMFLIGCLVGVLGLKLGQVFQRDSERKERIQQYFDYIIANTERMIKEVNDEARERAVNNPCIEWNEETKRTKWICFGPEEKITHDLRNMEM